MAGNKSRKRARSRLKTEHTEHTVSVNPAILGPSFIDVLHIVCKYFLIADMKVFCVNRRGADMFRSMLHSECKYVSFADILHNTQPEHEIITWLMLNFFEDHKPLEHLRLFLQSNIVREMINHTIEIKDEITTLLITSMDVYHQETRCGATQMLLDAGCDVNQCNNKGQTALHRAVAGECVQCMQRICAHAVKVHEAEQQHLQNCRVCKHFEDCEDHEDCEDCEDCEGSCEECVNSGEDFDASVATETCEHNYCMFPMNSRQYNGFTPLHIAVRQDADFARKAIVLLSEYKADLNKKAICTGCMSNSHCVGYGCGETALHHAVKIGSSKAVLAMLEGGADANETDRYGSNCLHFIARHPNEDVLAVLVSKVGKETWKKVDVFGHRPSQHSERLMRIEWRADAEWKTK